MSPADRIALEAAEVVSSWPSGDRAALLERLSDSPTVSRCESGGYLVDVGESFPVWRADEQAVRRLILDRALLAAEVRDAA